MRPIFAFLSVFALFFLLTAERISASLLESENNTADFSALPDRPTFSTDVDIFLGQKTRRRSGGGRVWSNLYYGGGTLNPKREDKIQPHFYGVQVGLDLAGKHGVYSTCFANANQSKMKFDGDSSTTDNYLLGLGRYYYLSGCHYLFTGSIGYDRYEIVSGSTYVGDGLQTDLFGEFGLDFPFGKWGFKPFYALQYDFLYHGRIRRALDVAVNDWNGHSVNQLSGLRITWKPLDKLELQGRAVWVHEMLDHPPPFYRVRFSPVHGTSTPTMLYYSRSNAGRDWAWLGAGGKLEGAFNIYLFLDYDLFVNTRHVTHIASVGLCFGW